ncbi:hypothetical protein OG439_05415 [Amycolatopsis sp. NBC_01307]|uniref:Hsp70 family protein n=1 Tax=Amycolatopsis sp. NBC_01307 TaxID=2903561 RepID=UPI002E0D8D57|nr:hypothetical protein OG439_05415 [Amycolatopsis sp. NBC_01307]
MSQAPERARRGVPRIEVRFDIDADSTVQVTVKDLARGKGQCVLIDADAARVVAQPDPHAALIPVVADSGPTVKR